MNDKFETITDLKLHIESSIGGQEEPSELLINKIADDIVEIACEKGVLFGQYGWKNVLDEYWEDNWTRKLNDIIDDLIRNIHSEMNS